MRKLLELIECARKVGHIPVINAQDSKTQYPEVFDLGLLDHFLEEGVMPFVFKQPEGVIGAKFEEQPLPDNCRTITGDWIIPNAPAKIFSIEFTGDYMLTLANPSEGIDYSIPCVLCVESKREGEFHILAHLLKSQVIGMDTFASPAHQSCAFFVGSNLSAIVYEVLQDLPKQHQGVVYNRTRFKKLKKKGGKHTIRRLVYVSPKKVQSFELKGVSKPIDYSHRFEVRGHYVQLSKKNPDTGKYDIRLGPDFNRIGKNRAGDYCLPGWTWRESHTKGPEDKPLIKNKVRIVK